jgi:hypothetical protein
MWCNIIVTEHSEEQSAQPGHQIISKYNIRKGGRCGDNTHYVWMRVGLLAEFKKIILLNTYHFRD